MCQLCWKRQKLKPTWIQKNDEDASHAAVLHRKEFFDVFFVFLFFCFRNVCRVPTFPSSCVPYMIKRSSSPMLKWNRGKKEAAKPVAISLSISQMNWWFHAWLVSFIFCFCFFVFFRWTTLSLPCAGMRTSLYSVVEFAAASTQSRRPIGTGQKSAVSMRHLWQRIRDRVITTHPHGQGTRSFSYEFICLCVASSLECVVCFDLYIHVFVCLVRYVSLLPCHPCHHSRKKTLAVRILHWTK